MAQSKTESSRDTMTEPRKERRGWSCWHLLLLIQFVAVLWPPFCKFPSTIERHLLARRGRAILNGFDPARRAERLAGEIIAVLCGSFLLGQIATSKPSPPLC